MRVGGFGFCTLPPILTRPGLPKERDEYLAQLAALGGTLTFLEHGKLNYLVPRFEEQDFVSLKGFAGRPWRNSDLLAFRKNSVVESELPVRGAQAAIGRYSRKATEFRAFQAAGQASAPEKMIVRVIDAYGANVSRRPSSGTLIDVWTSEKVGVQVENALEATLILDGWAAGQTRAQAIEQLGSVRGYSADTAQHVLDKYDGVLGLWSRYAAGGIRRTDKEIRDAKETVRSG